MARTTISQQLATAQQELAEMRKDFDALQRAYDSLKATQRLTIENLTTEHAKALKTAEDSKTYYSREADARAAELEQAHAVLDGVEGAPSREYEGDYGKLRRNVVTRLAGAFLAIARNGGAK